MHFLFCFTVCLVEDPSFFLGFVQIEQEFRKTILKPQLGSNYPKARCTPVSLLLSLHCNQDMLDGHPSKNHLSLSIPLPSLIRFSPAYEVLHQVGLFRMNLSIPMPLPPQPWEKWSSSIPSPTAWCSPTWLGACMSLHQTDFKNPGFMPFFCFADEGPAQQKLHFFFQMQQYPDPGNLIL